MFKNELFKSLETKNKLFKSLETKTIVQGRKLNFMQSLEKKTII